MRDRLTNLCFLLSEAMSRGHIPQGNPEELAAIVYAVWSGLLVQGGLRGAESLSEWMDRYLAMLGLLPV